MWLLAAVMVLGTTSVRAAFNSIDVNFYASGFGGSTATGAAVVGSSSDTWNGIDGAVNSSGGPLALVDVASNSTPITLSYVSDGAVVSANSNIQPNASLMSDYLFANTNDNITVTLQNLAPNTAYNLYVYLSSNDASDSSRAAMVMANAVSAPATGDPQTSFIAGENYVLLTPTSDALGTINITVSPTDANSDGEVDLNGLQLTAVPVPPPTNLTIKIVSTNVSLTFPSISNETYDIQSTTNLVSVPWSTIASNLPGTGAIITNIDVGAAVVRQKFYRVGVQQ